MGYELPGNKTLPSQKQPIAVFHAIAATHHREPSSGSSFSCMSLEVCMYVCMCPNVESNNFLNDADLHSHSRSETRRRDTNTPTNLALEENKAQVGM